MFVHFKELQAVAFSVPAVCGCMLLCFGGTVFVREGSCHLVGFSIRATHVCFVCFDGWVRGAAFILGGRSLLIHRAGRFYEEAVQLWVILLL